LIRLKDWICLYRLMARLHSYRCEKNATTIKPPSGQPGGIAKTADPIGMVHRLRWSDSANRFWIGTYCCSTSHWNATKISPDAETPVCPCTDISDIVGGSS